MELPESVLALVHVHGQIVSITTERECKTRKNAPAVTKCSEFTCRIGVNYDNIKKVQEKRETGELPSVNQGLSWGEWAIFPYIIHHKGSFYLRCTVLNGGKVSYTYHTENREITEEEAREYCLASEFKPKKDVFTIKVASIVEINHKQVA